MVYGLILLRLQREKMKKSIGKHGSQKCRSQPQSSVTAWLGDDVLQHGVRVTMVDGRSRAARVRATWPDLLMCLPIHAAGRMLLADDRSVAP